MSTPNGSLVKIIFTTLDMKDPQTLPEKAVYPNNVKRIIVKGTNKANLEPQFVKLQTNTFSTIDRNFNELYSNVEFEEL
tara:strand:+ start:477 stop:713 length:237 start_codon:yes stop_codon:yes gene_type:complete